MQRIAAGTLRDLDQLVYAQIAIARRRSAERVGFLGEANVERGAIRVAEYRDAADAQIAASAQDAYGNFSAIGD